MSVSVLQGRAAAKSGCSSHLTAANPSLGGLSSSSENISDVGVAEPTESSTSSSVEHVERVCELASPLRRVAPKRYYSSSESECLQSTSTAALPVNAENVKQGKRNNNFNPNHQHRGRAGKRRRFQSPSSNEVHGNGGGVKVGGGGGKGGKAVKMLARVPLTQQPKAPSNTTQFLITDREERESSDRDTSTDALGTSADFSKLRPRCYSSACSTKNDTSMESSYLMQSSDSDEEQEEEDRDTEFDTVYDNVSLERIQGLPRDKVNREMLTTQKCNSHLVDKVTQLKTENHRLKNLLQQHGIDFNKSTSSELNNSGLFSPSHMLLTRSSVESENNNSKMGNAKDLEKIERISNVIKQEKR